MSTFENKKVFKASLLEGSSDDRRRNVGSDDREPIFDAGFGGREGVESPHASNERGLKRDNEEPIERR